MAEIRYGMMWDAGYGNEATKWDRRRPTLEAGGGLHRNPEDGEIVRVAAVRANIQYTLWMETPLVQSDDLLEATAQIAQGMRDETVYRFFHSSLSLSDCRVIVEQDQAPKPRVKSIGHVRYPWISSVGFRPKQSFLNECVLQIEYQQNMSDDAGTWFHKLELGFDKTVDSCALAADLVHRIARHHLTHGAPEAARSELQRLATLPRQPDPQRGKLTLITLPTFVPLPGGAQYLPDGEGTGAWITSAPDATTR